MKKLFGMFMVAAMMVGCSNDNEPQLEEGALADKDLAYISVNIMSGDPSSRANDPNFESGIGEENAIKSIDFYFFKADGSPYYVDETSFNIKSLEPFQDETTGQQPGPNTNVEKITDAQIVIKKLSDGIPYKMVTIVNAPTKFTNTNLSDLGKKIGAFGKNGGDFIMSTSVFANTDKKVMNYTPLNAANVCEEQEDALRHPVNVYVERTLAKVVVTSTVGADKDTGVKLGDNSIVANLEGWNVTGELRQNTAKDGNPEVYSSACFLLKNIDPNWGDELLGVNDQWNDPKNHRSYWAVTPTIEPTKIQFTYQWNNNDLNIPFVESTNYGYFYENTTDGLSNPTDANHSKLIVKASFKCDGKPIIIGKWMNVLYNESNKDMKKAMAVALQHANPSVQFKTKAGGTETYEALPEKFIEYYTAGNKPDDITLKDYEVRPKVNALSLTDTQFIMVGNKEYAKADVADAAAAIQTEMNKLRPAYLWKNGGYYFLDITHLGTDNYGLVRNHVYKYTITSLKGLGTPIPDEKVIIPQTPEKQEAYIAAKLHILSWRIVSHEVGLE